MGIIYIVRHGETHWNKSGIYHGQYDIPLNYTGIKQATILSDELKDVYFDVCFCSPLSRAVTTAKIILKNHPLTTLEIDKRLMERGKGIFEGEYLDKSRFKKISSAKSNPYKIETLSELSGRVHSFIEMLRNQYLVKSVLIVSHSGTIKALLRLLNADDLIQNNTVGNCSVLKINTERLLERASMKKGFYAGVFDVLHTGHILAFEEAKKHCDYLIVGLQCCPNYKQPIQSIYERYIQIRGCKYVDEIIPYYDLDDCKNIIKSLDFDIYFLGEDHKNHSWENDKEVEESGKDIVYLSRKHSFSSSTLKSRIIEGAT